VLRGQLDQFRDQIGAPATIKVNIDASLKRPHPLLA
jgi:hypothetical protein